MDLQDAFELEVDAGLATQAFDLRHVRNHPFEKRGSGGRASPGCAVCRKGKLDMAHVGTPQSIRGFGSGANHFQYQTMKHKWQDRLTEMLFDAGVPTGLSHVLAEGQVCFPDRKKRDQGNYRFILEKALGDALVEGGWLPDDDWDHYEFGRLRYAYAKGDAWTALTIHASRADT